MESVKVRLAENESLLERLLGERIDIAQECEGLERLAPAGEDELDMLERVRSEELRASSSSAFRATNPLHRQSSGPSPSLHRLPSI